MICTQPYTAIYEKIPKNINPAFGSLGDPIRIDNYTTIPTTSKDYPVFKVDYWSGRYADFAQLSSLNSALSLLPITFTASAVNTTFYKGNADGSTSIRPNTGAFLGSDTDFKMYYQNKAIPTTTTSLNDFSASTVAYSGNPFLIDTTFDIEYGDAYIGQLFQNTSYNWVFMDAVDVNGDLLNITFDLSAIADLPFYGTTYGDLMISAANTRGYKCHVFSAFPYTFNYKYWTWDDPYVVTPKASAWSTSSTTRLSLSDIQESFRVWGMYYYVGLVSTTDTTKPVALGNNIVCQFPLSYVIQVSDWVPPAQTPTISPDGTLGFLYNFGETAINNVTKIWDFLNFNINGFSFMYLLIGGFSVFATYTVIKWVIPWN